MSHQIFVQNIHIQPKCGLQSSMYRVTDNSLCQETVVKRFTWFIAIMFLKKEIAGVRLSCVL